MAREGCTVSFSNEQNNGQDMASMIYFSPKMAWERAQKKHVSPDAGYIMRKPSAPAQARLAGFAGVKIDSRSPYSEEKVEARKERTEALRNKNRDERRHYIGALATKSHLDDFF